MFDFFIARNLLIFLWCVLLAPSFLLASSLECVDKQECFPKESSTRYLFEKEKIDKKLAAELKSAENKFVKQINSPELRKLLQVQFKKALELSDLQCDMIYYLSMAGGHWPGVHVAECKISYKKNHLTALRAAQNCMGKEKDENACIPLLIKATPNNGLEN